MAIPAGAQVVVYTVNQYGEGVEVGQNVRFHLPSSNPESVNAAAEAAMSAFVATLESLNPTPVTASRTYECSQGGDVWPAP